MLTKLVLVHFTGKAPSLNLLDYRSILPLVLFGLKEYVYKYFLIPFKVKLVHFAIVISSLVVFIIQFFGFQPMLRECREVEDINYVPAGRSLNETLLACNSQGYDAMRFILSATPLFSRWSTWPFPRYDIACPTSSLAII
jgi:hypothetical protein